MQSISDTYALDSIAYFNAFVNAFCAGYLISASDPSKNSSLFLLFACIFIDAMYGKGSAKAGAFAQALGFEPEAHKVVISCLIPPPKAIELTEVLRREHHFAKKNTGFAFSVPLDGLSL